MLQLLLNFAGFVVGIWLLAEGINWNAALGVALVVLSLKEPPK